MSKSHKTKMFEAASTSLMLQSHYDQMSDEDRKEYVMAVCRAFDELMHFRNIVNAMADLKDPVKEAVLPYVEDLLSNDQ